MRNFFPFRPRNLLEVRGTRSRLATPGAYKHECPPMKSFHGGRARTHAPGHILTGPPRVLRFARQECESSRGGVPEGTTDTRYTNRKFI